MTDANASGALVWLSGVLLRNEQRMIDALATRRMGLMCTPASERIAERGWLWAADNGCFGAGWQQAGWQRWLASRPHRDLCVFATLPDVVGDANATHALAHKWSDVVRGLGYRAAYVLQDGSEHREPPWQLMDALFIGGTTAFKTSLTAAHYMTEARARGLHVHVGRVNSLRRLRWAADHGAHTADGTYLRFRPNERGANDVLSWLDALEQSPTLWNQT